jgi:hypothetical protein
MPRKKTPTWKNRPEGGPLGDVFADFFDLERMWDAADEAGKKLLIKLYIFRLLQQRDDTDVSIKQKNSGRKGGEKPAPDHLRNTKREQLLNDRGMEVAEELLLAPEASPETIRTLATSVADELWGGEQTEADIKATRSFLQSRGMIPTI